MPRTTTRRPPELPVTIGNCPVDALRKAFDDTLYFQSKPPAAVGLAGGLRAGI